MTTLRGMACSERRALFEARSFSARAWPPILDAGAGLFCYDFAVRPVKLEFFDHPFTCPLCKEHIVCIIGFLWLRCGQKAVPFTFGEELLKFLIHLP